MPPWKRILLIIPPTGLFVREGRCQTYVPGQMMVFARPPLELAMLAALGEEGGARCLIRDYPIEHKGWSDLDRDLETFQPGLLVLHTTESTLWQDLVACTRARSLLPGLATLAVGPSLGHLEKPVFERAPELDFALHGEIEPPFRDLLAGKPFADIPGLVFREGPEVKKNPRAAWADLDSLPLPARHLLRNDRYVRPSTGRPQAMIEVQRGCAEHCTYCLAPATAGTVHRYRDPAAVVEEMRQCRDKLGIRDIFIRSDNLTAGREWVREWCRRLEAAQLGVEWLATSRVDQAGRDLFAAMKRAGCWGLSFGIESGDPETLRRVGKGATIEQAREAVSYCRELGIVTNGFFVFGFPWDTRESIRRTISFACGLGLDNAEFLLLVPFRDTPLRTYLERHALLTPEFPFESYAKPGASTHHLSPAELVELRREAVRKFFYRPRFFLNAVRKLKGFDEWRMALRLSGHLAWRGVQFAARRGEAFEPVPAVE